MKNLLCANVLVTLLFISLQLGAQKFTTTMGPRISADSDYAVGGLLDANAEESYVYFWHRDKKTEEKSLSIAKHNEALEEVWFKNFQPAASNVLIFTGKNYFYRIIEKETQKDHRDLLVEPIDRNGKAYKPIVLKSYSTKKNSPELNFKTSISPDSTKLVFLTSVDGDERAYHGEYKVYNDNMELLHEGKLDLTSTYGDIYLGHIWVDNNANIFGEYYEYNNSALKDPVKIKGPKGKSKVSGYDKTAFFITAENQDLAFYQFDFNRKFEQDRVVDYLPSGDIRVITTLMDQEYDFLTELLFWEFSPDGQLLTFHKNELSEDDHKRINNRPGPATRLSNIVFHTIIPDGSSLITLEQNYTFTMGITDYGATTKTGHTSTTYGSADVHLVKFNPRGEIVKYADLNKIIESFHITGALSHSALALDEDSMVLFYNDHENNDITKRRELLQSTRIKGMVFCAAIYDGTSFRREILLEKNSKQRVLAQVSAPIENGFIFIVGNRKGTGKFHRLLRVEVH